MTVHRPAHWCTFGLAHAKLRSSMVGANPSVCRDSQFRLPRDGPSETRCTAGAGRPERTMARIPSTRSHRRGRDRWLLVAGRSERNGGLRSASQPSLKPAFPARLRGRVRRSGSPPLSCAARLLHNQRSSVAATHGFRHETARARLVRHLLSPSAPPWRHPRPALGCRSSCRRWCGYHARVRQHLCERVDGILAIVR